MIMMALPHQHRSRRHQSPAPCLLLAMMQLAMRASADCRVGMGPVNVRTLANHCLAPSLDVHARRCACSSYFFYLPK